jgi:hypothetical protein
MQTVEIQNREFQFDFTPTPNGLRLWVTEWDGREWQTVDNSLHPLATQYETLCNFAAEELGDTVFAEEIAETLGVPFRFFDDAECEICGAFWQYSEMVIGADFLPEILEKTDLGNFDYACHDCYTDLLIKHNETESESN